MKQKMTKEITGEWRSRFRSAYHIWNHLKKFNRSGLSRKEREQGFTADQKSELDALGDLHYLLHEIEKEAPCESKK